MSSRTESFSRLQHTFRRDSTIETVSGKLYFCRWDLRNVTFALPSRRMERVFFSLFTHLDVAHSRYFSSIVRGELEVLNISAVSFPAQNVQLDL